MNHNYRLDDGHQTIVLTSTNDRLPQVTYWGRPLPQAQDLNAVADGAYVDATGGMLDETPDLSICPEATQAFPGQPGLNIRTADGHVVYPSFHLAGAEQSDTRLTLTFKDAKNGLTYVAEFETCAETGVLKTWSNLSSDAPIHVQWFAAPVLPAPAQSTEMIDFAGRWIGEFQEVRTPWTAGIRQRNNRTGRTGHEHFPALIVPVSGASNTQGEVYAFHYGWSGGHQMIAEELPDGRRQVQFGHATDTELSSGHAFSSAPLYVTYSDTGMNGCATAFQRHLRDKIVQFPDANRPRPVHYNCWEAVYFDHDLDVLKDIAKRAAELGAERFVLDDGWFGKRDDDTTSLGDWTIDPRKFPDGLSPLIDHIHTHGMQFGIWFEPEMVNPNSDLYRSHPDWALGAADQPLGRHQMVLNMALPEVRDYLYDHIAAVLGNYDIDYIKWDHNRVLPTPDAAQTRGFYDLVDRLRADFPTVEIESCSSGGGRIDFGVMERTHRVWLSDSNDALERLRIQHSAALFLPLAITGSHVGPRVCHTSGRILDISLRAWTAAQRHIGFEMDPRELTDHEATVLTRVTSWWKENRDWMTRADILRLDHIDPAIIAEQQLAEDGSQFVVFAGKVAANDQVSPRPLRLANLNPDATYRISLVNPEDADPASRTGSPLIKGPLDLSGAFLMSRGVTLQTSFPQSIWVLKGERL